MQMRLEESVKFTKPSPAKPLVYHARRCPCPQISSRPTGTPQKHVRSFPRIVNPHIPHRLRRQIPILPHHILRQRPFLHLILIMQHEDTEPRLLGPSPRLPRRLHILLKLSNRILERGARVVHLVHDQHVLADQVRHLERGQVQPLRARHLRARRLHVAVAGGGGGRCGGGRGGSGRELLVEGEPDRLDGDVGAVAFLQEGAGAGGNQRVRAGLRPVLGEWWAELRGG